MPTDNSLQRSKQAIDDILRFLCISQIVYVDDIFVHSVPVEQVIGSITSALEKSIEQTQRVLPKIPLGSPYDVWVQSLTQEWPKIDTGEQTKIAVALARIAGIQLDSDAQAVSRLRSMFSRSLTFHACSPLDWLSAKDEILTSISPQAKVLCLFDHDLSQADGFSASGPRSGAGLIHDLLMRDDRNLTICGLITHTIPSLEAEEAKWREIADENGLALHQFLPLAKIRLADDASPLLFADGIKKTVLNMFCEDLKKVALGFLSTAFAEAQRKLTALDVYDFDYMVLQGSLAAGEWEIETLMRIWQLFQRDSVNELILDPTNCGQLNEVIDLARSISQTNTEPNHDGLFWNVRRIRSEELYERELLVKSTSIQLGDIFRLTGTAHGNQAHILLAQPCDLVVRRSGARNDGDIAVPLVPITGRLSLDEAEEKKETFFRKHFLLHYFFPNSNDVAIVDFSKAQWISTNLLDLAVIEGNGNCRLDLNQANPHPGGLTPGWRLRIAYLMEWYRARQSELENIKTYIGRIDDSEIRSSIWQAVMPRMCMSDFGLQREPYQAGVFDFGLQRIARLRQPGADHLLRAYSVFLSRDADAFDLYRHTG